MKHHSRFLKPPLFCLEILLTLVHRSKKSDSRKCLTDCSIGRTYAKIMTSLLIIFQRAQLMRIPNQSALCLKTMQSKCPSE